MILQKSKDCFLKNLYKCRESIVTIQLPSDCLVVFRANESEKQDIITFCTNLPKKRSHKCTFRVTLTKKEKKTSNMEMSCDNGLKRCLYKQKKIAAPKSFLNFHSEKWIVSSSYKHSISFTHGLQDYEFLAKANLSQLCGVRQMPRKIWKISLVQKSFQLIGCKTQSFLGR